MLNIACSNIGELCRITVVGDLALDTIGRFLDGVAVRTDGIRSVLLDCTQLSFLDSTGARALLQAAAQWHGAGIRFEIANLSPEVKEVLEMLGFFAALPEQP